jgi:hypothetical protein
LCAKVKDAATRLPGFAGNASIEPDAGTPSSPPTWQLMRPNRHRFIRLESAALKNLVQEFMPI